MYYVNVLKHCGYSNVLLHFQVCEPMAMHRVDVLYRDLHLDFGLNRLQTGLICRRKHHDLLTNITLDSMSPAHHRRRHDR